MSTDFLLPDLGEGLTESELIAWHVAEGELVELNQPIAEVETAKAIVQLPSPFAGTISQLYVEASTTVAVGAPIMAFDLEGEEPSAPVERNSVLVGYGPPVESDRRPQRRRGGSASRVELVEATPATNAAPAPETATEAAPVSPELADVSAAPAPTRPRTTPPIRKLAADLGVDLATVTPTGADGLITRADVQAATAPKLTAVPPLAASTPAPARASRPDRETRIPIKGVRKATADAMVLSAFTAPHATEFLMIDVTPTVELVAELREKTGQRITLLSIVSKALCIAAARTPAVNSRWDDAANEIVQFGYVNLGIAVATPRGLLVPNIRDAQDLSLTELTDAIYSLATTARDGATSPASLSGGTISITNIGVFGIDAGTPILVPGEAAILAMGATRRMPWEFHGEIALRDVMTLSLSFDHRIVDGAEGSKFLAEIGAILANPGMVLTMV